MNALDRPFVPSQIHAARSRPAGWAWIALGGLAVGSADMLFAMAWWAQSGVAPARILQSVWSWVAGRDAFWGGTATALAGAALYFVLMSSIVGIYHVAARRHRVLRERPVPCGALYGAAWFVLLHVIVVPWFSAAPPTRFLPDWNLACLLAHMLLIGIPAAWMSRRWYATR
ncbi:hypothetical protein [Lysobacter arvi]|uniref:DUF1440 domain-containing protein n=1 Tax=Lysobacter arvi TaxID=3038776 RepID=A0ABU1CDS7_9GAMM|nr:hypothetical protein [Lysobacter arvi]MDR0183334.1 hypothetical protein [Lysobacter arvi]